MENHFEKRVDPRLLVEGARSVISVLLNYYTKETQKDKDAPKISKYAYGKDYHFVLKDKLKKLLKFIKKKLVLLMDMFLLILPRFWKNHW